jgi:hypothetical protein
MTDADGRDNAVREITLTSATVQALMADRELMAEMERVREEQGQPAMLAWLDAHGLEWREGGSTPEAAFASGGFETDLFDDPFAFGDVPTFGPAPSDHAEARAEVRRRQARKAQKKARKASRRR